MNPNQPETVQVLYLATDYTAHNCCYRHQHMLLCFVPFPNRLYVSQATNRILASEQTAMRFEKQNWRIFFKRFELKINLKKFTKIMSFLLVLL